MPIHPQAQAVQNLGKDDTFDYAAGAGAADAVRKVMDTRAVAINATPPAVSRVEDRFIPGPGGPMRIRLYWPLQMPKGPLPIYVFFHSGGYVVYTVESADPQCRIVANAAQCIVANVDYRQAPEAPAPAAAEDGIAAIAWLRAHAASLGGDPTRVAAGGESCGGTMASVAAIDARDRGLPQLLEVVMVGPLVEMKLDGNVGGMAGWMRRMVVKNLDTPLDWRVSPLASADLKGLPPHLIIAGEFDGLRGQSEAYADKLKAAGAVATYHCVPGMIHNFTGMGGRIDAAHDSLALIARSLKTAFQTG